MDALRAVPGVGEVRGMGLLIAAELDGHEAKPVADELLQRGLVVNAVTGTALRLAPPITVSSAEIATAVGMIRDVLA